MKTNTGPLADEYGDIIARINELKARQQELRSEILETGESCIRGEHYTVGIRRGIRKSLDIGAIGERFGQSWIETHSKQTESTFVRAVARPQKRESNKAPKVF